jgi:NAD(P)-dependent dehydrogenase (short-subunit alcohol dehydrogenase family)
MIEFEGQTVLVGGGAGEIGASTAKLLASLGATVSIADTDADAGAAVLQDLQESSAASTFVRADLTDQASVQSWVSQVLESRGSIEVAINTVGWTAAHPFVEEDDAYWRNVVDVNLMSCAYLAHAVIPAMSTNGYGRIVLTSSLAGRISRSNRAMYGATKAGIIGLTKALAREVALDGVTVNCVAPGTTETKLMRDQGEENTRFALAGIPTGKIATTLDQAHAFAFLASKVAGQITGQTLSVDGGSTMV